MAPTNPYGSLGVAPAVAKRIDAILSLNKPPTWQDALGARSRGLNTRYGLPRRAATPPAAPADPFRSVNAQVDNIIQTLLGQVAQQQAQARAQAEREAALEMEKAQALAEGLKALGISGNIQQIFGNAANTQAGLASGFSGAIKDQAAAQAAAQQRALAGTGQEAAVRNEGDNMGNVQYGLGGYIPASTLNTQAANYSAEAALQPGFALQFGQLAQAQRLADYVNQELPTFTQQTQDVLAQRPDIYTDVLKSLGLDDSSSSEQANYRPVQLANGQYVTFDPNTGSYSKPYGPTKTTGKGSTASYQAKPLGNGMYVTYDPNTGATVGKPWGVPKAAGSSSKPVNYQKGDIGNGKWAWFNPKTGKQVSPAYAKSYKPAAASKPKAAKLPPTADQGGRLVGRTDGITPTQARKAKATAYTAATAWHANGETNDEGTHYTWKQFLGYMVNQGGIPYDLAIRQLARFSPQAQKALKSGVNALTGESTRAVNAPSGLSGPVSSKVEATGNGYNASTRTVDLPASFTGTHVTDGLGWGTKTARDFMAPPGSAVRSPVSGTVLYFHASGAQGGGSMLIRGDDGYEYWLGHIQDGIAGGRVTAGQQIARVAFQTVSAPHVHVDRRYYVQRA